MEEALPVRHGVRARLLVDTHPCVEEDRRVARGRESLPWRRETAEPLPFLFLPLETAVEGWVGRSGEKKRGLKGEVELLRDVGSREEIGEHLPCDERGLVRVPHLGAGREARYRLRLTRSLPRLRLVRDTRTTGTSVVAEDDLPVRADEARERISYEGEEEDVSPLKGVDPSWMPPRVAEAIQVVLEEVVPVLPNLLVGERRGGGWRAGNDVTERMGLEEVVGRVGREEKAYLLPRLLPDLSSDLTPRLLSRRPVVGCALLPKGEGA